LKKQAVHWPYTTRLQKGGALLEETRTLVRAWSDTAAEELCEKIVQTNVLNKKTRARMADVYRRTFLPRFIEGPIPNAWKLVRPLEDADTPLPIVRPVYYWISAKAEPMLSDFCREYILPRAAIVRAGIGTAEVVTWLYGKGCLWSPTVAKKVARGLLAALRDFGILEGRAKKRLETRQLHSACCRVCLSGPLSSRNGRRQPFTGSPSGLGNLPAPPRRCGALFSPGAPGPTPRIPCSRQHG
jgi:Putative inner membrane protein (DUF1819)